jgi:hypothetical protein
LFANKIDLVGNDIDDGEFAKAAADHHMRLAKTSARTGISIDNGPQGNGK